MILLNKLEELLKLLGEIVDMADDPSELLEYLAERAPHVLAALNKEEK